MKKLVFILSVILVVLVVVWLVSRLHSGTTNSIDEYQASTLDEDVKIVDIIDLEEMAAQVIPEGGFGTNL